MAITFSKSISTTELLNTYNNNVVEFSSDNVLDSKSCNINIGGFDLVITPDSSNLFRYNFKEIAKVILDNRFADDIVADADIKADPSLINTSLVTYTVTFSDDSTEQTTETYSFVKSVEQIANVSSRLIAEQQILVPTELTFFKGLPIDFAHYSDGDVTLINSGLGVTKTLSETATDTYRIYLLNKRSQFKNRVDADGGIYEDNICWEEGYDYELLKDGWNTLCVEGTTKEVLTINLKDICDGAYLKWFNRKGGWSYWLFESIYSETSRTKTVDQYTVDFESLKDTFASDLITGKTSEKSRRVSYSGLTDDERLQVIDIFSAPRVELYNGVVGEELGTWKTVKVKDGTFTTLNTKRKAFNVVLDIELRDYTHI
jgi:hypothetical protein